MPLPGPSELAVLLPLTHAQQKLKDMEHYLTGYTREGGYQWNPVNQVKSVTQGFNKTGVLPSIASSLCFGFCGHVSDKIANECAWWYTGLKKHLTHVGAVCMRLNALQPVVYNLKAVE